MPESFGARLRQRREQRRIALTTIAQQTKIGVSLLDALERDDVSHWPSGIFRRSFIRDYARAVGLDPDAVVREFLERYPDPLEAAGTDPALTPEPAAGAAPPTRLRYAIGSAVSALFRRRRHEAIGPSAAVALARSIPAAVSPAPGAARPVPASPPLPPAPDPDLSAAARLCTELGRAADARQAAPVLQESARVLDAVGLIVWAWNPLADALMPALAHGYPDQVLAQLPRVGLDADNPTAAAFRAGETCVVSRGERASGALVVPLMTPAGCVGVLAIELRHGREQRDSVRALAAILAAQLARLIESAGPTEAAGRRLA